MSNALPKNRGKDHIRRIRLSPYLNELHSVLPIVHHIVAVQTTKYVAFLLRHWDMIEHDDSLDLYQRRENKDKTMIRGMIVVIMMVMTK